MADPYRPEITLQDMVDEFARAVRSQKATIGEAILPAVEDLSDELRALMAEIRQPTWRERLGLWLMRCPAVPWRRTHSTAYRCRMDGPEIGGRRNHRSVAHAHGPLTGLVVRLGRWLAWG